MIGNKLLGLMSVFCGKQFGQRLTILQCDLYSGIYGMCVSVYECMCVHGACFHVRICVYVSGGGGGWRAFAFSCATPDSARDLNTVGPFGTFYNLWMGIFYSIVMYVYF